MNLTPIQQLRSLAPGTARSQLGPENRSKTGRKQDVITYNRVVSHFGPLQLSFGPAILPDFMTGIYFNCILAWPTVNDTGAFHRVANELIAQSLRLTQRANPSAIEQLRQDWRHIDWDEHLKLAKAKRRMSVGTLKNRLKQRMAAARMGLGLWHKDIPDIEVRLPEGMTRVSIDQLSKLVRSDTHIDDPENIEKLIWRQSLPVIHLAMAAQVELHLRNLVMPTDHIDTQDQPFFRSAAARAHTYEGMILKDPMFASGRFPLAQLQWFG